MEHRYPFGRRHTGASREGREGAKRRKGEGVGAMELLTGSDGATPESARFASAKRRPTRRAMLRPVVGPSRKRPPIREAVDHRVFDFTFARLRSFAPVA